MTSPEAHRQTAGIFTRVWEWFTRAEAARKARAELTAQAHLLSYARRARIAAEVGERTLHPSAPWTAGGASHLAAALFAESIGWSLRLADARTGAETPDSRPASKVELERLSSAHRDRLREAAGDDDALHRVLENLIERKFELATASDTEGQHGARELGQVANRLLEDAPLFESALDRVYLQRIARIGATVLVLLVAAWGVMLLRERAERSNDLSIGKPWRASSSYEVVAQSPSRAHADKGYFFHTLEEANPWLEIDLLAPQAFSKVRVFNRKDCCTERATPLIVEVSTDRVTWKQVAKRSEPFTDWRASFKSTTARWIRLRVPRRTLLHFDDVRVIR